MSFFLSGPGVPWVSGFEEYTSSFRLFLSAFETPFSVLAFVSHRRCLSEAERDQIILLGYQLLITLVVTRTLVFLVILEK